MSLRTRTGLHALKVIAVVTMLPGATPREAAERPGGIVWGHFPEGLGRVFEPSAGDRGWEAAFPQVSPRSLPARAQSLPACRYRV